jgi:hypothetical protein
MRYGFQNRPFLGLILCQKHSVPTLKTLSHKTYKDSDILALCGMLTGYNTLADIAQHAVDLNHHVSLTL